MKASDIKLGDRIWHTSADSYMTVDEISATEHNGELNIVFGGSINDKPRRLFRVGWQDVSTEPAPTRTKTRILISCIDEHDQLNYLLDDLTRFMEDSEIPYEIQVIDKP